MDRTQGWKVLVIDDDEDDYVLVRAMLEEAQNNQFEVEWAPDYHEGRRLLKRKCYHAVLVDYDLGGKNGIDLIRESIADGCDTPLVLYTGRGDCEVHQEAARAGAALYLSKCEANPALLEHSLGFVIQKRGLN